MTEAEKAVSVVIAGRVQGVSYRAWTQTEARRLGLSGFVRNRSDGDVEALFRGRRESVDRMIALCWSGPPGARVSAVSVGACEDAAPGGAFEIRRD